MKRVKKILFVILGLMISFMIILNLYNIISLKVLKKDLTTINGYGLLEVVSGSMEPTIHVHDFILINIKDKNYQVGDIITFKDQGSSFVTHRIIEINEEKIKTKGDNNKSEDEWITKNDIVGKYVKKINQAGAWMASLKSPFTMVMILIIGVLVCIFVSTDKEGNPIMSEDEKEFQEFIKLKEEDKKEGKKEQEKRKDTSKKVVTKKATAKKTVASKKKETTKQSTVKAKASSKKKK